MPPAPWHMGTPPMLAPTRFMTPWSIATVRTVIGRSGKSALFSSTVATIALPSVNATWGSPRTSTPVTRSSHPRPAMAK